MRCVELGYGGTPVQDEGGSHLLFSYPTVADGIDATVAYLSRPGYAGILAALQAAALNNLSGALKSAFQATGNVALLEEAVTVLRRGAAIVRDDATRAVLLSNLAGALEVQYGRDHSPDVLRESVRALRDSLALRGNAGPVPAQELVRLANLLRMLSEQVGDRQALGEAIAITQQAADGAPPGPDKAGLLSNLGVMLCRRYEVTDDPGTLHEAIEAGRAAVTSLPDDHLLRASVYTNVGNTALLCGLGGIHR